jgi:hypothetical protein
MDTGQIRGVLTLWAEHGGAFEQWLDRSGDAVVCGASPAAGGCSRDRSPPARGLQREDSGVLLASAAANADLEEKVRRGVSL